MNIQLTHNTYGKHRVRVSKIKRDPQNPKQHQLIEVSVDVVLEGDLDAGYLEANNELIVATDTIKNTVYVLAKDDPFDTIESFGVRVAEHFVNKYDHLNKATVTVSQNRWERLLDCPHAFSGNTSEIPGAVLTAVRDQQTVVQSGLKNLLIAKTTESGFSDFHRDEFRTLPDTDDRILATSLSAEWIYETKPTDFSQARETIRSALLSRFIDHYSVSVQQTLMLMAKSALESSGYVSQITLAMPNKHHVLFNLKPFDRENNNDVFVVTDEPFGYIQATISRDDLD